MSKCSARHLLNDLSQHDRTRRLSLLYALFGLIGARARPIGEKCRQRNVASFDSTALSIAYISIMSIAAET
eukprot:scaffold112046_cov21-Prasinocladus_malaysianus.AAC.1